MNFTVQVQDSSACSSDIVTYEMVPFYQNTLYFAQINLSECLLRTWLTIFQYKLMGNLFESSNKDEDAAAGKKPRYGKGRSSLCTSPVTVE
jgi:hypothetical protein